MNIHRGLRAPLVLTLVLATCMAVVPVSRAQQEPEVVLTLLAQTPITTLKEPILEVTVRATNLGTEPIDNLSVVFTIAQPVRSRNLYEASLIEFPTDPPIQALPFPKKNTLEPGQRRLFTVEMDLSTVGASTQESLVYPAQVDLRSRGVPVAHLNTAAIHLVRVPEQPVRFAWWAEVSAPIAFDPQGRLADAAIEDSIGEDGALAAEVQVLRRLATDPDQVVPIDVVVQPALLEQLQHMAGGYERLDGTRVGDGEGPSADAAAVLAGLREMAGGAEVELSATPFAGPLLPALLTGGLAADLGAQRDLGDRTVEAALGRAPVAAVDRPVAGALDQGSVDVLVAAGVDTILANADTVARPPQPLEFAPPSTATIAASDGTDVALVLPDPGTQALLEDPELIADPVRTAQVVLGELATIWREQPVPEPPTVRGLALGLPADLPAGIWGPIVHRIARAPFLQPVRARDLVVDVNPPGDPAELIPSFTLPFSTLYVDAIREERRDVEAYRWMLADPEVAGPASDRLQRNLLYAESGQYVGGGELAGRAWIDQVNTTTGSVFERVQPLTEQVFTFTSATGTIPLRMGDPGPLPLKVEVQLRSSQFEFPEGGSQLVVLERPDQIVSFRVDAKATGLQPIHVVIRAPSPSGRILSEQNLAVRTAAVNRLALLITLAAALVLVGLWSRRYIRRPRS